MCAQGQHRRVSHASELRILSHRNSKSEISIQCRKSNIKWNIVARCTTTKIEVIANSYILVSSYKLEVTNETICHLTFEDLKMVTPRGPRGDSYINSQHDIHTVYISYSQSIHSFSFSLHSPIAIPPRGGNPRARRSFVRQSGCASLVNLRVTGVPCVVRSFRPSSPAQHEHTAAQLTPSVIARR